MQVRPVNPRTWLGAFNVNQAIEVRGGQRVLYVSGQTSNDASEAPMHAGDLVAQFKLAWKNLVEALFGAIVPVSARDSTSRYRNSELWPRQDAAEGLRRRKTRTEHGA